MMYQILMPVDTDESRAVRQATFITALPHAAEEIEVVLQFVYQGEAEDAPEEVQAVASARRIESVKRAMEQLEEADVEFTLVEESGDTAKDIIERGEEDDVDLIVLGGRKRSPAGKILFGSVTQTVLLNSDRPVAVTGG